MWIVKITKSIEFEVYRFCICLNISCYQFKMDYYKISYISMIETIVNTYTNCTNKKRKESKHVNTKKNTKDVCKEWKKRITEIQDNK